MFERRISTLASAFVIAVAAGCGGAEETASSLDETVSCLEDEGGVTVSTDADDLYEEARDAGDGALSARFPSNSVTIAFERSDDDAKSREATFRARAALFPTESPVKDLVQRHDKVVVLWEKAPNIVAAESIDDCLGR